jgi:hypothetical protein
MNLARCVCVWGGGDLQLCKTVGSMTIYVYNSSCQEPALGLYVLISTGSHQHISAHQHWRLSAS